MTEIAEYTTLSGTPPAPQSDGLPFDDNRLRLQVDAKQVETWELMIMESARISDWLMVFPRYLCDGGGLVSPSLPSAPIDELTAEQVKEIKDSKAYKMLKRFHLPALRAAAQSFVAQAVAGF